MTTRTEVAALVLSAETVVERMIARVKARTSRDAAISIAFDEYAEMAMHMSQLAAMGREYHQLLAAEIAPPELRQVAFQIQHLHSEIAKTNKAFGEMLCRLAPPTQDSSLDDPTSPDVIAEPDAQPLRRPDA